MDWTMSALTHHLLWVGALFASAALSFVLARWVRIVWLVALIAAPLPAMVVFGWFLCLEVQQPYGPFLALVGVWHAVPALLSGTLGAVAVAFWLVVKNDEVSSE